jgi:hypothetical protein
MFKSLGQNIAARFAPQPKTVAQIHKFLMQRSVGSSSDQAHQIAQVLVGLGVLPNLHSTGTDQRLTREQNQQLWMRKLMLAWPKQQIDPQAVSPRAEVGRIAQLLAQQDVTPALPFK